MRAGVGQGGAGIGVGLIAAAAGALGVPSSVWILVGFLGCALLFHALVSREQTPPTMEQRIDDRPPPEFGVGRHFVSVSTPELLRPFREYRAEEAERLTRSFIGCWIKAEGVVPEDTIFEARLRQDVALSLWKRGTPSLYIFFAGDDTKRLRNWSPGDKLRVVGRIDSIGLSAVVLRDCELI